MCVLADLIHSYLFLRGDGGFEALQAVVLVLVESFGEFVQRRLMALLRFRQRLGKTTTQIQKRCRFSPLWLGSNQQAGRVTLHSESWAIFFHSQQVC